MSQAGIIGESYLSGNVVQRVHLSTGALISTNLQLPFDDTIPQQTEGAEVMTLAITPTKATNRLFIEFSPMLGGDAAGQAGTSLALFQDATANALAATLGIYAPSGQTLINAVTLRHDMVAGTTSSTTFKIRFGTRSVLNNAFINGLTIAQRRYGGVASTVFTITEYEV